MNSIAVQLAESIAKAIDKARQGDEDFRMTDIQISHVIERQLTKCGFYSKVSIKPFYVS